MDKTKFIEELVNDMTAVHLITRPRRFGKTLNLSMLKYFYDIEGNTENRKLFDGLYISNSSAMSEQGKYPVIFLSFKDIKALNVKDMFVQLRTLISNLFNQYKDIRDCLDERDKINFERIWYGEEGQNYSDSLKFLASCLKEYYNQDVILLIDEYDTPMVSAYEYGYYDEIKMFFTTLYGSTLKENPALKKAVLTGIMRISKENIFSGLNNVKVNSILEEDFAEYFGTQRKR